MESPTGKTLSPTGGHDHRGVLWANGDCNDRLSFFFSSSGDATTFGNQLISGLRFVDDRILPRRGGGGKDLCR